MTRTCITFCTPEYRPAAARLAASARPWFDVVKMLTPADIDADFRNANARLFECRRGFGFWIWKPYLILRELERMGPDDVLFYADSQCIFEHDPARLFELTWARGGIGLFHQRREKHKNSKYTRGDCFAIMGCDGSQYRNGDNLATTYSVWTGTDAARAFVREWLEWCCNYQVVSDEPSVTPNSPDFKDHRHDQSVCSLLAIKHGIKTLSDPSQWGDGYREAGEDYPRIINVARSVKSPWYRRPTMSSIVEVSTTATCPMRCSYCPQDKLGEAYDGPKTLTIETFHHCLDNMVPGDAVYFAGFTEPCVNPDAVAMMELSIARGHRTRLYTTGRGLSEADARRVAAMGLDMIMLHLPDAGGALGHADSNLPTLDALANHPRAECMAMGNVPHDAVGHLWNRLPKQYGGMIDRAGNVGDTVEVPRQKHAGPIKCGAAPQLDHPVLLPSGEMALCCCDYSLTQIVGNLSTTPLSEILGGAAIQKILDLQRNGGDILCRSCSFAVPA